MKYRIVSKQNKYFIQIKGFLWGWDYEKDGYAGIEVNFNSQQEAEEYIESQIEKSKYTFKVIKTY